MLLVALALVSMGMGTGPLSPAASPTETTSSNVGVLPFIIYAIGLIEATAILVWLPRRHDRFPRRDRIPQVPLGLGAAIIIVFLFAPALVPPPASQGMRDLAIAFWIVAAVRLIPIGMWLHAIREVPAPHARERYSIPKSCVVGLLGLVLIWPLVQLTQFVGAWTHLQLTGETTGPLVHDTLVALREEPSGAWAMLAIMAIVIAVPLAEEVLYRGTVYGMIRSASLSRLPALLLSSALFAAVHYPVVPVFSLPSLAVLGLGFAIVYEITGRLTACVVMHGMFNLMNVVLMLLLT